MLFVLAVITVSVVVLVATERRLGDADERASEIERSVERWERLRRDMSKNGGR